MAPPPPFPPCVVCLRVRRTDKGGQRAAKLHETKKLQMGRFAPDNLAFLARPAGAKREESRFDKKPVTNGAGRLAVSRFWFLRLMLGCFLGCAKRPYLHSKPTLLVLFFFDVGFAPGRVVDTGAVHCFPPLLAVSRSPPLALPTSNGSDPKKTKKS